jgi:hypothetical protein
MERRQEQLESSRRRVATSLRDDERDTVLSHLEPSDLFTNVNDKDLPLTMESLAESNAGGVRVATGGRPFASEGCDRDGNEFNQDLSYARIKGVWDTRLKREYFYPTDELDSIEALQEPTVEGLATRRIPTAFRRQQRVITFFVDGPPTYMNSYYCQKARRHLDGDLQHPISCTEEADRISNSQLPHIFVFHAMMTSGNNFLMSHPPEAYVLVCINRYGYFGSGPIEYECDDKALRTSRTDDSLHCVQESFSELDEYSYEILAADIHELATRHFGIRNYVVAGHSSGGPCALACAAYNKVKHSTKDLDLLQGDSRVTITAVGILAGDPEYGHEKVPPKKRLSQFCLGFFLPKLLRALAWLRMPYAKNTLRGVLTDYRLETAPYSYTKETDVTVPVVIYWSVHFSVGPK